MRTLGQSIVASLNRLFGPHNPYSEARMRSPEDAFEYAVRAGKIVYDQFYGANDFNDKVVLDYGCGAGGKTAFYASQGPRKTIGVDCSLDPQLALDYARRNNLNLEFQSLTPDGAVPVNTASCDVVINSSVLEHVKNPLAVFRELKRILKPGGLLLNRWHPFRSRHGAHLGAVIGIPFAHLLFSEKTLIQEYYRGLIARRGRIPAEAGRVNPDSTSFDDLVYHLNRASIAEMRRCLELAGFQLKQRRFFRGKKESHIAKLIPESIVDYAVDYEVQICTPLCHARVLRQRSAVDIPASLNCDPAAGELANAIRLGDPAWTTTVQPPRRRQTSRQQSVLVTAFKGATKAGDRFVVTPAGTATRAFANADVRAVTTPPAHRTEVDR